MKFAYILGIFLLIVATYAAVEELTPSTFDKFIASNDATFVHFFAPWCGHCRRMAPAVEEAGAKLQEAIDNEFGNDKNAPTGRIAKVNCDVHKEFCKEQKVSGYPTNRVFNSEGQFEVFKGERSSERIIQSVIDELHKL